MEESPRWITQSASERARERESGVRVGETAVREIFTNTAANRGPASILKFNEMFVKL